MHYTLSDVQAANSAKLACRTGWVSLNNGWISRMAVEQLDTHRNLHEVNPLLPFANSKHAIPVKSDVYRAGILKAEEPHDS